jgi:thiol-disulfide isomerase/thioredoxin
MVMTFFLRGRETAKTKRKTIRRAMRRAVCRAPHRVIIARMPIELSRAAAARDDRDGWIVACLCAAWCRTCDGYQPQLARLAARDAARFFWIDIEDDDAWVGELDVETFPTLLVLGPGAAPAPLFFGPLPPQIGVFERTLRALREQPPGPLPLAPEVRRALADLGERLRLENG